MPTSAEYTTEVQKLYVAYFTRPGDPTGVAFWIDKLQTATLAYQDISAAFAGSAEYGAIFAGKDNAGIVATVYENLFGRAAEAGGMDFWINALNTGATDIDNVVLAIGAGAQGHDGVVQHGKTSVATLFTQRIDTDTEIAAYGGAAALQIASDYLAGVKDLQSGAQHMDAGLIDAAIARIVGTAGALDGESMAMV